MAWKDAHSMITTEAIVLSRTRYQDTHYICTLLTKDLGRISLFVNHLSQKKSRLFNLTTPLTQGEYIYKRSRSKRYFLIDADPLSYHLKLRQNLKHLQVAMQWLQLFLSSQHVNQPSPKLYTLLSAYLRYLPNSAKISNINASFQLKMLHLEGLIPPSLLCSECENAATSLHHHFYCEKCKPPPARPIPEEVLTLYTPLIESRSFRETEHLVCPPNVEQWISLILQKFQ